MSSIKYHHLTKEIEIEGTEAFIEANVSKIQNLLIESHGEIRRMLSKEAKKKANQEPTSFVKKKEPQAVTEIARRNISETLSTLPATESSAPEISHDLKANRPPLRKYIRREGIPGHERAVVEVIEKRQKEISIAALKEKFGLSESKIEGIIRDAEKLGKVRRVMNGSYVWTQD
jgi:uncharacterized membrane protein